MEQATHGGASGILPLLQLDGSPGVAHAAAAPLTHEESVQRGLYLLQMGR